MANRVFEIISAERLQSRSTVDWTLELQFPHNKKGN